MSILADLVYTKSHEWVRVQGDVATCGITHFAQESLGDVVYVDLPEEGAQVTAGKSCAEVESVKAVSDIYAPVSGEVIGTNAAVGDEPETVNADPYGEGWLFKIRMSDPSQVEGMMSNKAYAAHVAASAH